jgi:hypothetical protein
MNFLDTTDKSMKILISLRFFLVLMTKQKLCVTDDPYEQPTIYSSDFKYYKRYSSN